MNKKMIGIFASSDINFIIYIFTKIDNNDPDIKYEFFGFPFIGKVFVSKSIYRYDQRFSIEKTIVDIDYE